MIASVDSVRLGSEFPQILHEPPEIAGYHNGDDAIALANEYMFDAPARLSPSQELRLRNGMATRADGRWAASRVGDFGGRQGAGKTDTIIARILAGVFLCGHKLIIYTAHEFPTANEIFLRLSGLFEAWDDLAVAVQHERRAHGDQGFELRDPKNGVDCRILIKTRTGKSGRGFAKADLIIYDEAQHLLPEHVAGSGPAKLAHPNPQSWYAGSGGLEKSVKAWEMRRQALTGTGGRLSYTEHTAQIATVTRDGRILLENPDLDDPVARLDACARANPGLGRWVTEEGMEDLRDELGDLFPREGLCVWEPEPHQDGGFLPFDIWCDLAILKEDATVSSLCYGVSVSPDGASASIASAGRLKSGDLYFDNIRSDAGTAWLIDAVVDIWGRKKVPFRVNPGSVEGSFIRELSELGVGLVEVTGREYQQTCGEVLDRIKNRTVRHLGQPALNHAVSAAQRRDVGKEGGWVWAEPLSGVDLSPLKAATLALSGVAEPEDRSAVNNVW